MSAWQITWFTVLCAVGATVLILPPGVALAWLLAKRRFPGRALLEAVVTMPLVVPPVATGLPKPGVATRIPPVADRLGERRLIS